MTSILIYIFDFRSSGLLLFFGNRIQRNDQTFQRTVQHSNKAR